MCYTYDNLSRVIEKTVKNNDGSVISTETFDYDAAGNIIGDTSETIFEYDTNNRLEMYNGFEVTYDMDGNMVSNSESVFDYDSSNRLVRMDGHFYTYNAEDVRIKCVCDDKETTYTYNTNCKLSQLLTKTTNGVVTKYVYGLGLIGEEASNTFKTYHFDCRGSTIAITDASGNITDTFAYDTYGKLLTRTGTSKAIFGYNGRDGVVTDDNGLIYMRARYYSPAMKRFINADVIVGAISNAITLNRFAYANGNPVSFVDPFGLSVFDSLKKVYKKAKKIVKTGWEATKEIASAIYHNADEAVEAIQEGGIIDWGINKFKELTQEGKLDNTINFFIGATPDNNGIYHIDQNYWQSIPIVGYNDLYDKAFEIGVGMTGNTVNKNKFEFTTKDGTDYVIWMWKGDYINLGSGAEVGIYKESAIPGHWLTSTENAMPMSLKLQEIDSGKVLFDYHPSENQWWINGFDPSNPNAYAENLQLTVTIDFSNNPDIYAAFKETWDGSAWKFNDMQATYTWRNK